MKKYQAFKFQLQPTCEQEHQMRQFAGCCRFVWNKALELEKETYESTGKRLGLKKLSALLPVWKKEKETAFLADANAQTLVQSVRDLDR
ncbi:MAG: transposase, partial [Desulfovibrionaceae bacterium]|nr:transposase [Desulfovibrionaceae bacterium]